MGSVELQKIKADVSRLREMALQEAGKTVALETILLTLVELHPHPQQLRDTLRKNVEIVTAMFLGGALSETPLTHFQAETDRAFDLCERAIAQQSA